MKHFSIFVLFQFFFLITSAQSQSDSNYSFGLKLLSIEELPKVLSELREGSNYYTSTFNGLVFKINDNQISYRFQGSILKKENYSFKNECTNCEIVNGDYDELNLKIGFERNITYSKLQPFYGIDLGYKGADFKGESKDATTSAFLYHANVEKYGVSISPIFGLKYNVIKSLTVSAESAIDFLYTTDKEIKSNNSGAVTSTSSSRNWQFINKPLAMLSVQFNFGSL